ncbi:MULTISPECIES: hypothetical protein [Herbaspirillum]|uniref:hypothetical protein n=1 Tax=Herbaspirillum TaxID=963 RepID=UPI000C0AEBE8|nr:MULTISPECIES: hypothetical protein [Herbaspirillum]MAF04719.1 hypothetical protein [Herbaspirillum sp.]UWE19313.1 hypothetical protein NY669_26920 [Herbaspirillum huttiense]|tara:strand:- start:73 stop:273 length:201 start_codon:yes stop_codon:yes gene_type:complete
MSKLTLIEAQTRYIDRVLAAHPGHVRRVTRSAWSQLFKWAEARSYVGSVICRDADDMLKLEQMADD